jgi:molybdopterin molybdotransferase
MAAKELVELDQARRMVLDAVQALAPTPIGLDAVLGRVLREDISAGAPVPAFDNSAMDGFAVRASDLTAASAASPVSLTVVGESRAGRPSELALQGGETISISTGAMLPAGADAVVKIEDALARDGVVEFAEAAAQGQDVRRAGEDIASGQRVLERGIVLGPAELGVLASLGRAHALCSPRPRVSVVVTGDELMAPGERAREGGVRDTSTHTIRALARCAGGDVGPAALVGDDLTATMGAVAAARENADVVVISGGVSVGLHDQVRPALSALGARESFWGVALKPGRPTWFGMLEGTPVFGLPGNPVSAMVTFTLLVRPALHALQGGAIDERRFSAVLDRDYEKPAGRAHAVRCRLRAQDDGWHAEPTGAQGSHILTSMLGADALAIVARNVTAVRAGERVAIEPLHGNIGVLA